MEFVLEFFAELFLTVYMELMLYVAPQKKAVTKKHRTAAKIIAVTVLVLVLGLVFWGVILVVNGMLWGLILICLSVVISAVQIALGLTLKRK